MFGKIFAVILLATLCSSAFADDAFRSVHPEISYTNSISEADKNILQADFFYSIRGESFDTAKLIAECCNIDSAILCYKRAADYNTGKRRHEALWKLMQACFYKGYYCTDRDCKDDKKLRREAYDLAMDAGRDGLEEFPHSAELNLWMAILWGAWADDHSPFTAAQKGVAGKIKNHCHRVLALDPYFADAYGFSILGRLHTVTPKIPLFLGWPSKDRAIAYLEKAFEIAPDNLVNKKWLAEAYYKCDQKLRAKNLMLEILAETDTMHGTAEDAVIKNIVRRKLNNWEF
ncbi:MAG: hypothetical protein GF310_02070 [candidate division Zixibacteria bacterium]|nr:hypothetical protein [candidate division Zixibacteria bacterium]